MGKFVFAENLKNIRKGCKMKQSDVVALLKCSKSKYAGWEQGRTEPDIESLRQLCRIFNVSADELLEPQIL